jgi:ADP-ribose pyrophosphatase
VGDVRTLRSREVYRNDWMQVREDHVAWDDGATGIYGVVDKPDFALVIPIASEGFWLVEQFRYPISRRAWEFPQGSWGAGRAGSMEELARAELAEETGLRTAQLRHLGHLFPAYGFSSQGFDVFVAGELTRGAVAREDSERDMVHMCVSEQELCDMIGRGDIVDAATLAAYTLLRLASPHALSPTAR